MTIIEIFSISFKQNYSNSNKPPKCNDEIWNIILKGLNENPQNRPTLNQINELKPILQKSKRNESNENNNNINEDNPEFKEYAYVENETT